MLEINRFSHRVLLPLLRAVVSIRVLVFVRRLLRDYSVAPSHVLINQWTDLVLKSVSFRPQFISVHKE